MARCVMCHFMSVRKPAPSAGTREPCGMREGRSSHTNENMAMQTDKTDRVLQPAVDRRGFRTDTTYIIPYFFCCLRVEKGLLDR
jgi:hypothetical protein